MSRRMAARDGVMVSRMEKWRNYVFSGETLIILLRILGDDCGLSNDGGSLERVNSNLPQLSM